MAALAGLVGAAAAQGTADAVTCRELLSNSAPTVVLLDSRGNKAGGPIDLGRIKMGSSFEAEGHRIGTGYRVAACKSSKTYKVALFIDFRRGEKRPYVFETGLPDLEVLGSDDYPVPVRLDFNAEIRAVLVEP